MTKKRLKLITLILGLCIILTSCYDNEIYYKVEGHSVLTCNNQVIKSLTISAVDGSHYFHFRKKKQTGGTSNFNLIELNQDYDLEIIDYEGSLKSFRLFPQKEYIISNLTYGDAASGDIRIKTNELGEVEIASITTCD